VSFEHGNKALYVPKTETVACCGDCAVPNPPDGKAWKPTSYKEPQAPCTHQCKQSDTKPSHVTSLENAEVLQEQGDLNDCTFGYVCRMFDVEELRPLAEGSGIGHWGLGGCTSRYLSTLSGPMYSICFPSPCSTAAIIRLALVEQVAETHKCRHRWSPQYYKP